jgi:hypothetical protein
MQQVLDREVEELQTEPQQDEIRELSVLELTWIGGGTGTFDNSL